MPVINYSNNSSLSNRPFVSKLIEKIVFLQFNSFLTSNNTLDIWHVAFPRGQPLGLFCSISTSHHDYADDTQIYIALSTDDYVATDSLNKCIEQINDWM